MHREQVFLVKIKYVAGFYQTMLVLKYSRLCLKAVLEHI